MQQRNGVWHSLVVRLVRDQEAAGSSPVTPTSREPRLALCVVEVLFFKILCRLRIETHINNYNCREPRLALCGVEVLSF